MIAVLTDTEISKINESFGVSSCLELPLFSETYGEEFLKNIRCLNPDKIYLLSEHTFQREFSKSVEIIKDITEITAVISQRSDDFTCFFFSKIFFEYSEDILNIINSIKTEPICIKNEMGEVVCLVFPNSKIRSMLAPGNFNKSELLSELSIKCTLKSYSKSIAQPDDYRCLIADALTLKFNVDLPEVAQGIFAQNRIPKGDFVIIPPVFFGDGIQIESGCVIGPGTAIMDNCLISQSSNIRNSFLCSGSYISSGCYLDGVLCCENVSVRRNTAAFSNSVLGKDCVVGEDSLIESDSYIRPYTKIDNSENKFINYKRTDNQSPAGFYGYTPEKAALLGAAIGVTFNSPKIAVACDGEMNSTALKLALLSGLITTGASCYDFGNSFLSSIHYFIEFCELDCGVFISGNKGGTVITVFKKGDSQLTNSDYYNIKNLMLTADIKRCKSTECRSVRQIHGMQRMYIRNLLSKIENEPYFMPSFECENRRIQSLLDMACAKITFKSGKKRILFKINRDGTKLVAESNSTYYSHGKIADIVSHFLTEKGDLHLKDISGKNKSLWRLDGVILCFELMGILEKNNITLNEAFKMLPTFYVAENTIFSKIPLNRIVSQISDKNIIVNEGQLEYKEGSTSVRINKVNNDTLKIAARAVTVEAAREIVGNLTDVISGYLT